LAMSYTPALLRQKKLVYKNDKIKKGID